jgi:FAD:protein FMN transferase
MGSPISLTSVVDGSAAGRAAADRAWSAVVDEFEAGEVAMSRFRESSEVTTLNRACPRGTAMTIGRRLGRALATADRAHRMTGGRFDPRVLHQLDDWGYRGADLGAAARADDLGASDRIVERVARDRVRLPRPVDLGGIGKGLAVRWARDRVRAAGVDRFLLDAGGDMTASGDAPDGGPWRIGIEDPAGGDDPLAVVAIRDGAIATSSIRRLRWTSDGRDRHHLVDPQTGEPADDGLLAVTVAATDPAWAEVWSKALFVAGRAAIAAEARSRGLAAWWVGVDGCLEMTPAARQRSIWVAGEA